MLNILIMRLNWQRYEGTVKRLVGTAGLAGTGEAGDESTGIHFLLCILCRFKITVCISHETAVRVAL